MANVVGQRHEIYKYQRVEDIIPRKGEIIIVNNTPDYGVSPVTFVGDGFKTVQTLYREWNNGVGSPFRTAAAQDVIDTELKTALATETSKRRQGDKITLAAAKSYTDEAQLATQTWLRAQNTVEDLSTITGLSNKINYLCRVIKDKNDERDNNGVYQAIAGWEGEPVWSFFGDNSDFIDETELEDRLDEHNTDETAHEDIRETIAAVKQNLQSQISALLPEGIENLPELLEQKADKERVNEQLDTLVTYVNEQLSTKLSLSNADEVANKRFLTNILFPVGRGITIGINDPTPTEMGWAGVWENWSGRAEGYRLGALPWPYSKYAANTAYAANAFVINPLASGWGIYRATAAITAANNTVFNPAQWTLVLALAEGEHIPYRLFAATAVFAVNDLAVNYWADNYVPTQADYAANVAYAAGAYVRVLVDTGHWKIYKAIAAITAPNNTAFNPAQWELVYEARQGYKGVFACTAANTAANPPVLNPAQWKQIGDLVPAYEYLPFVRYAQNANYTADTYVIWHLPGSGWELFKAKAAITTAAEQLDPVLWEKYKQGEIIERRFLQDWLDDDFEIGHIIEDGEHAGLCVLEMVTRGGTFPSYEGGNRPRFIDGGVAGDMARKLTGIFGANSVNPFTGGAFYAEYHSYHRADGGGNWSLYTITLDSSLVMTTGPENSPRTFSVKFWRRVA